MARTIYDITKEEYERLKLQGLINTIFSSEDLKYLQFKYDGGVSDFEQNNSFNSLPLIEDSLNVGDLYGSNEDYIKNLPYSGVTIQTESLNTSDNSQKETSTFNMSSLESLWMLDIKRMLMGLSPAPLFNNLFSTNRFDIQTTPIASPENNNSTFQTSLEYSFSNAQQLYDPNSIYNLLISGKDITTIGFENNFTGNLLGRFGVRDKGANIHPAFNGTSADLNNNPEIGDLVEGGGDEGDNSKKKGFNHDGRVGQMINSGGQMLNNVVSYFHPVENTKQSAAANTALDTISLVGAAVPGPWGAAIAGAAQTLKLVGNLAATKVDLFKVNENLAANQEAAYGNAFDTMRSQHGGTYDLWSLGEAGKLKKLFAYSKMMANKIGQIDNEALDYFDRANDPTYRIAREVNLNGPMQWTLSAKTGAKILRVLSNKKIIELQIEDDVPKFKIGGTIELPDLFNYEEADHFVYEEAEIEKFQKGGTFNVIPEGALHARKHNMDIEGITKKGIPVISESEGGEIEQQAEIECNEIILRLSVTEQIEEARKQYKSNNLTLKEKDNIAIEIGKLLTLEILYNTLDKTNLIEQIN